MCVIPNATVLLRSAAMVLILLLPSSVRPTHQPGELDSCAVDDWTTLLSNNLDDRTWQHLIPGGPHVNLNHKDHVYTHTCGDSTRGDARRVNGSVHLVGDQGMASSVLLPLAPSLLSDMEAYDDVRLRFWYYTRRFSSPTPAPSPSGGKIERYLVEYCAHLEGQLVNAATGTEVPCQSAGGWTLLAEFFHGQDFQNDQPGFQAVTDLPRGGTKPHLRFRMDAGGSGDYLKMYLDSIEVQGLSSLVGFAAIDACGPLGTTGGHGGQVVTASNEEVFYDYASRDGKYVILVNGMLGPSPTCISGATFCNDRPMYHIASDKSILGLGSGIRFLGRRASNRW